jgi:hypothetical protein
MLSIAYNKVLAHMKEIYTKLTLILRLEVFSFFCFGYVYVGPYNNWHDDKKSV